MIQHRLIAAHAGKVVDVAGFGQTDNRVDQQVGLRFTRGAKGQFLMRPVQWVAGLERHNLAPAQLAEIGAQFVWGVATGAEIVMDRLLQTGDRATKIGVTSGIMQIIDGRMRAVVSTENHLGFAGFVRHPFIGH